MPTLIIGYGNIDRGDDGVAWHIMYDIYRQLSTDTQPDFACDEIIPVTPSLDMFFALQLTPEMALDISNYHHVCFLDCHTGNQQADFYHANIDPVYETSPFTHHLTPEACLSLVKNMTGKQPEALHVSIRGYEFDFTDQLSTQTKKLTVSAVSFILDWLKNNL